VSITPTSIQNLIRVNADGDIQQSAGSADYALARLYRASGGSAACATAIGNIASEGIGGTGVGVSVHMAAIDAPQTASQITYTTCVWGLGGGNGIYCVNFGGGQVCTIQVEEIMGRLERGPANDNDNRLGLVG
jgi:hypothetical protein